MTIDDSDIKIIWAAMQAMVNDLHAPQDCLTSEQWTRAEAIMQQLDEIMDGRADCAEEGE